MPLDALAPDQRAVVQLVLQRGRSYAQIAELLKISEDAVRVRAHAGLSALGPDVELTDDEVAGIADFLLGQQNGKPRQSTRKLLRENDAAYLWAATVRASLEPLGPLPELPNGGAPAAAPAPAPAAAPADEAAKPAPRPRPRTRPVGASEPEGTVAASSSRLGGALLIGGGVLVVVIVVLFLFVFGGDDKGGGKSDSASATATPTATATPQAVGQIALKGAGPASKADGVFALFLQGQQLLFAVQMQNMPATPTGKKYALWLTGSGTKPKWIGDTPDVAKNGVLQVQGPRQQDTSFTKDIGKYRRVLLTQETGDSRSQPGTTLARGTLQRG